MKDYNQMTQAVFRRRDEYLAAQKKKKAMLLKAGVPLCTLVLVVLMVVALWPNNLPEIPTVPTTPTINTEVTATDYVQPTKPVASAPEQDSTEPQTVETTPFVPMDPVEKPMDAPATSVKPDYVVDATSATVGVADDAVPPCSPERPEYTMPPATEGLVPEWTLPMVPDAPSTEAPTVNWGDATEPCTMSPTEGGPEQINPTLPMATEPATGPVEILVGGVKCTAQTGDMVSYTAELYVKDLFESFAAAVVYSDNLDVIEVVDPMEEEAAPIHYPNLTGGGEMMNYHYNRYSTEGKDRVYVLGTKLSGYNFKEQKVLFKFDFMVTKPGEAELALEIHDLCKKGDGTPYFLNKKQYIFEGIDFEEYLTVTPADEVIMPTAPKDEDDEPAPPFTYPTESYEGDMLINCDGRTYAADVGQRITYVVELEADQKFEDADIIATYTKGLDLLVPEDTEDKPKEDVTLPNLVGAYVGYNTVYTVDNQTLPAVKISASRIPKYDFRRRKVLLQLDFIVTKPGEAELDVVIEGMTIKSGQIDWRDPQKFTDTAYFYLGEQLIFEGIEIYEYVIVH